MTNDLYLNFPRISLLAFEKHHGRESPAMMQIFANAA